MGRNPQNRALVRTMHPCDIYPQQFPDLLWRVSENLENKAKSAHWRLCKIFIFLAAEKIGGGSCPN